MVLLVKKWNNTQLNTWFFLDNFLHLSSELLISSFEIDGFKCSKGVLENHKKLIENFFLIQWIVWNRDENYILILSKPVRTFNLRLSPVFIVSFLGPGDTIEFLLFF